LEYFHLFPDEKNLLMAIDPIKSNNTEGSGSLSLTIKVPKKLIHTLTILLAPFAPHLAEELWVKLSTLNPQPSTSFVRIWFEDQGIGIEKQYHDKIWETFQQLSKSYEGTGIGLALVRKVVARMGGYVGVESEPGQGSCFWVEFKAAEAKPQPTALPQAA
jgi:signal transduction histidine kinase